MISSVDTGGGSGLLPLSSALRMSEACTWQATHYFAHPLRSLTHVGLPQTVCPTDGQAVLVSNEQLYLLRSRHLLCSLRSQLPL